MLRRGVNLVCELQEHLHDDSCYEEVRTLTCSLEESEGHHHTDACYEKVLVCGKEVHTHSEKCYEEGNTVTAEDGTSTDMFSDSEDAADSVSTAVEAQSESYVPVLDPLDMPAMFNRHTDFYYYHAEEGKEIPADSAEISDWRKIEEDTTLVSTDLVKMYLAYTIPAGSLNETNPSARYRLPDNLHLSDQQINALNGYENGIAAGYKDSDTESENYQKYLGAEAVEGDRRPDAQMRDGAQEYISAVVRAENVYDEKGDYLGQDLIFTFAPYSIEKNRNTYDIDQTLVSAGEKITGWFACDLRLDQIDWEQEEDNNGEADSLENTKEKADGLEDTDAEDSNEENDNKENVENIGGKDLAVKAARVIFVQEDRQKEIEEISRVLRMEGETGSDASDKTLSDVSEERGEDRNDQAFKAGSLNAEGDDYSITLDYGEDAQIPDNASLSVREITAETDKEAYEACLEQAGQHVASDDKASVDQKASRFFDIEIVVTETNSDGTEKSIKIEPSAPVSVHIQINDKPASQESKPAQTEPAVLHFGEDGVEQIDSTVTESQKKNSKDDQKTDIQFEAESFSVYGVVYTVDFHWEVNGEKFDFSMPGGGFVSMHHLVEVLGITKLDTGKASNEEADGEEADGDADEDESISKENSLGNDTAPFSLSDVQVSEDTRKFVAEVENITFSTPSLLSVSRVEENTIVGAIKDGLSLECEYSAELTEEQIEQINAEKVEGGDWALISLKAFSTEESLTVTMKNGDQFEIKVTDDNDRLGLNGRTFAIVTNKGNGGTRSSLQANVHTNKDSRGYYMEARRPVTYTEIEGVEYCDRESTAWSFEYNAEKDAYYVSNNGKYLYIDPDITSKNDTPSNQNHTKVHALNLVSEKNEGTLIKITRDENGNYYFGNKNGVLLWDYNNSYWLSNPDTDEGGNRTDAAIRLCLPEDPYGSHKASLTAAKDLSNGQTVVIYQKMWNSEKDEYDFFAIDGNGNLRTVWESGDSLYWKNDLSIEWTLRELTDGQGNPTGYLQLYNEKTHTYLAPKTGGSGYVAVTEETSLNADTMKTVSVSLPGRDSGSYASRIATWDYDANTTYGLEVRRDERGKVSEGDPVYVNELLKSQEFYFAVRDPLIQKQLTTVDTVDSVSKGITITMYNFSGTQANNSGRWFDESSQSWQTANDRLMFMTNTIGNADWRTGYYWPGLMNRTLESDGYPKSTQTGQSLGNIFNQSTIGGKEANHLFLQSVYDTTGYYYYSGFENFARLPQDSSDFVVYDQLGTPTNQGTTNGEPSHPENFFYYRGNFMPFNELDTGNSVLNYYEGGDQRKELSPNDPRKSEDLYAVKGTPDYFFGMIMESKFQQGPNGLSDQGDPMVFEFTGDDDMWVYVDGVLLLDIGGIHDAFHGRINFQTGKITVDVQKTGNDGVTYIREQYWQARRFPDGTDWNDRNDPKQFDFFTDGGEENGKLVGTYKDYSTHDLKMFYMERGKGASNLMIQFNLPVITGDEFRVTKNMLETASGKPIQNDYADAAFYYKAYIKSGNNWVEYKHSDMTSLTNREAVYDDENKTPVVWKDDYIFEVKPGVTAVIPVADSSVEYKVVEVEPEADSHMLDVYNVSNSDQDPQDPKSTTGKTVKQRGQVFFDNKPIDEIVNELRIVKKLHGSLYKDTNTSSGYVEAEETGSPYFEYRIFLESTSGEMVPYSLGEYYQIDGETGKYVYYDSQKPGKDKRCLAETETAGDGTVTYIYTYANGTTERLQEPKITEHTSQNGSIGDVRPDDIIIVKGLLEGTDFIVDERVDCSHMTISDTGNWNNKYYYSNTEVAGAYIRGNGDADSSVVNLPENWKLAEATIYHEPIVPASVSSLLTEKEARGTIIANSNSEVKVHNHVYNQFELPLEKNWSEDFNPENLSSEAQVTLTLKRYKLDTRSAVLTLNATVTGAPAGYDQTYILTNNQTQETFTVKYSEMSGSGNTHSISLNLPVGTYTVTCEGGPTGYDAQHTKSSGTVTVTASDEQTTGGIASPDQVDFSSSFTRQSGSVQVTKNLAGFHGNNSFEKFKALYFITDLVGNQAQDTDGNPVNPVTLQYSDFNGGTSKTITFDNLPAGQYLVREQLNGTAYDDGKYTIINTADPESRIVTVSGDTPGQMTFTSTYTEVKSNPVKVEVVLSNIWNSNVETLYSNTTSFRPGDQIVVRYKRKDNNTFVRYRINNGTWSEYSSSVGNSGRDVTEEIFITVPENGVRVEFQDNWTELKAEHITVQKNQNSTQASMTSMNAALPKKLRKEAPILGAASAPTTDIGPISNTAEKPVPEDPNQRYQPDSWQLIVTMTGTGKLLDKDGIEIGTCTIQNGKWSVSLKGADFDGLTGKDSDGNLYFYYIDSVGEKNVPVGTVPAIDTDTISGGKVKRLYSENDLTTEKVLSVTNELIIANKTLAITKTIKGTSTPLTGAKFRLTRVDENGNLISGDAAYSRELEVTNDQTGMIEFTELSPGIYKLEETLVPPGYISKEGPYYIVVNNDGSTTINAVMTGAHTMITPADTSGFKVENEPGAALPNTGGIGTNLIYFFGIMLTGLAGAGLLISRRKRTAG